MRGWTLLRGTYWTLVSSPLSLGRRGSFRPRCLLPPLRDGHSWPQSRAGPHPRRPLPAALLTGLRGRVLGNPKAVHLAEVAGQQAHARRRQDHGAQAPESALGGESRGADRVGLGERARARAWGPGTGEGLGPGRPSVISRGATLSSHATPNLSLPCTTEPPPQKPENTPIQTSCPQDPRPQPALPLDDAARPTGLGRDIHPAPPPGPPPPPQAHPRLSRPAPRASAPPHLDAAPLAAHAGQHVGRAASLSADLAARARGQISLAPVVEVRVLRRGLSAGSAEPPPPPRPSGPRPSALTWSRCPSWWHWRQSLQAKGTQSG